MSLGSDKPDSLLEPAYRLLDDHPFWRHLSDGLALFVAKDLFKPYRLPIRFDELVSVADRFHVKPILPLLTGDGRFYLLALSQNQVRLFQCTKHSVRQVALKGVPTSLDEALKYDEVEKQLQFHTRTAGRAGRRPAMFHGHGVGTEETKDRILRFLQEVDKGIQNLLSDENIPMVIASVDYLAPIFKQATSYPHILEASISGNPDEISPQDLHSKAVEIISPYFEQETKDRLATYRELLGTDKTSSDVEEVVRASFQGRVEVLFVSLGAQRWGNFNPANDEVRLLEAGAAGAIDLSDFAAAQTLLNGGAVYASPARRDATQFGYSSPVQVRTGKSYPSCLVNEGGFTRGFSVSARLHQCFCQTPAKMFGCSQLYKRHTDCKSRNFGEIRKPRYRL